MKFDPHPTTSSPTPPLPWGAWARVRPVSAGRVWGWGLLCWLLLAPLILLRPPQISGNVSSRYMTIESLSQRGTLAIERSPLLARSGSPDVVRFGMHLYSDKPPVLPTLATPIYFALRMAGVRFTGSLGEFVACNFALTWLVVGTASALTLVALRALLQGVAIPAWSADLATLAFGIASPLLTYAVTFNNHSVAAGCVTAAWALALLERPGRATGGTRFLIGLLAGLAATIDLPVGGLTLAGLGLVEVVRGQRAAFGYALGAVGPLLLHGVLQAQVTGSPLPAEMYPGAFDYPGSYWLTPEGQWIDPRPRWQFGLDFLVGRQGAFTVLPALWFGVVGLVAAITSGRGTRAAAIIVATSVLILLGYYVWGVRRTDFAGSSFGVRHLLAIEPLVYLFAILALTQIRPRSLVLAAFVGATLVGGVYAVAGAFEPWSRVETRAATNPWLRSLQRGVLYPHGLYRGAGPPPSPTPTPTRP